MDDLIDVLMKARGGDLHAYGRLVSATQGMVHAIALSVLRDEALPQDAAQECYLRAFHPLQDLSEPRCIPWLAAKDRRNCGDELAEIETQDIATTRGRPRGSNSR